MIDLNRTKRIGSGSAIKALRYREKNSIYFLQLELGYFFLTVLKAIETVLKNEFNDTIKRSSCDCKTQLNGH